MARHALIEPMPRQWSPPSRMGSLPAQFGMHRVVDRAVPGGHFRQMAVAVDGGCQGLAGPYRLPRSSISKPWASMTGPRPATRRASGPMEAPRARRCRWALRSARCREAGRVVGLAVFCTGRTPERKDRIRRRAAASQRRPDRHGGHILAPSRPRPHCHGVTEDIAMAWRRLRHNGPKAGSAGVHFHIHTHDPLVPAPSFLPAAPLAAALRWPPWLARFLPPSRSRCASA